MGTLQLKSSARAHCSKGRGGEFWYCTLCLDLGILGEHTTVVPVVQDAGAFFGDHDITETDVTVEDPSLVRTFDGYVNFWSITLQKQDE